jgi:hypothetical protein
LRDYHIFAYFIFRKSLKAWEPNSLQDYFWNFNYIQSALLNAEIFISIFQNKKWVLLTHKLQFILPVLYSNLRCVKYQRLVLCIYAWSCEKMTLFFFYSDILIFPDQTQFISIKIWFITLRHDLDNRTNYHHNLENLEKNYYLF